MVALVRELVALDRKALVALVLVAFVLMPGLILAAIVKLTHGFDPALTTRFEWVAASLATLVLVLVLRAVSRELVGVVGLRVDDEGIARGRTRLAWAAITEVGSPRYGMLELRDASGGSLRISTYLLRDRESLLRYVGDKLGVALRERTLSL